MLGSINNLKKSTIAFFYFTVCSDISCSGMNICNFMFINVSCYLYFVFYLAGMYFSVAFFNKIRMFVKIFLKRTYYWPLNFAAAFLVNQLPLCYCAIIRPFRASLYKYSMQFVILSGLIFPSLKNPIYVHLSRGCFICCQRNLVKLFSFLENIS